MNAACDPTRYKECDAAGCVTEVCQGTRFCIYHRGWFDALDHLAKIAENPTARLDRAVEAVERDYALFGDLRGQAVPIGRDTLREIVRAAMEAADGT